MEHWANPGPGTQRTHSSFQGQAQHKLDAMLCYCLNPNRPLYLTFSLGSPISSQIITQRLIISFDHLASLIPFWASSFNLN